MPAVFVIVLTAVLLAMRVAAALLAAAPIPVLASVTLVVGKLIIMVGITLALVAYL